jgi:hypothetical protein
MADIRIKDITTTASSTASGDFFVIDGTTGTRKVNAFNPTFGGNATVTGTLTVNGASTLTGATTIGGDSSNGNYLSYNSDISGFCGLWMRQSSKSATNYVLASNGTSGTLVNATGASLFLRIENTTALEINTSRNVLIPTTTASTTTSTGALVVGNGTSGGLGVGGAIFAGDSVTIPNAKNFVVRNAAGSSTGIRMYADSSDYGYIDCTANTELRLQVGAGTKLSITNTGNVSIPATTASTSTSSGALVVSGGVGVAGDVYAGGTTGFKLGSSSGAYRFSAGAFIDAESSSVVRLLDSSANFATVKTGSLIALTPATAPSLTVNSTMTFELTSNTTLKVFVRGTDGTTRSVSLTLA